MVAGAGMDGRDGSPSTAPGRPLDLPMDQVLAEGGW